MCSMETNLDWQCSDAKVRFQHTNWIDKLNKQLIGNCHSIERNCIWTKILVIGLDYLFDYTKHLYITIQLIAREMALIKAYSTNLRIVLMGKLVLLEVDGNNIDIIIIESMATKYKTHIYVACFNFQSITSNRTNKTIHITNYLHLTFHAVKLIFFSNTQLAYMGYSKWMNTLLNWRLMSWVYYAIFPEHFIYMKILSFRPVIFSFRFMNKFDVQSLWYQSRFKNIPIILYYHIEEKINFS